MDKNKSARVSIEDAARRVGHNIYVGSWIEKITEREEFLIARYVKGSSNFDQSSIVPPIVKHVQASRAMAEWPSEPMLREEVERARDRDDWCSDQWRKSFEWLENHGFDLDAEFVEDGALTGEIAKNFLGGAHPSTRPRGAKPRKRERIIDAMKSDLANGYDLSSATEEELATKYGAARDTCRRARNSVLSKIVEK